MATADLVAGLAASVSAAVGAQFLAAQVARDRQRRVASDIKRRAQLDRTTARVVHADASGPVSDPLRAIHTDLFERIGALSMNEYVADDGARAAVTAAMRAAERLVDGGARDSNDHIHEAFGALERGDLVAACARMRLGVELAVQEAARNLGVDVRPGGIRPALSTLVSHHSLSVEQSRAAQMAFATGSRGLHGEAVTADEVRAGLRAARDVVRAIEGG